MTTQTEELLWIAAQEDQVIPKELIIFAKENSKSLYDLINMDKTEFIGVEKKSLEKFLSKREKIGFPAFQKIFDHLQEEHIDIINYRDPFFPSGLKELSGKNVPVMLYHKGQKMKFVNCIAIVGTRNCSTSAAEIAREVSRELAKKSYVIVAGLARGIDAIAHRGAISVKGKTIGVLPWMFNPYPKEHGWLMREVQNNGCIISENFLSDSQYDRYKFLQRNAVISGISELLIAVESYFTGGTRWQVELALSQGKKVIAIEPDKSREPSYNGYLKFVEKGAIGMSSPEEVIEFIENKVPLSSNKLDESDFEDYEIKTDDLSKITDFS